MLLSTMSVSEQRQEMAVEEQLDTVCDRSGRQPVEDLEHHTDCRLWKTSSSHMDVIGPSWTELEAVDV